MIYLDTHVIVRLYQGEVERVGAAALEAIESNDLVVSPVVVLELEYLHEIGRLRVDAQTVVEALAGEVGLKVCDLAFGKVVEQALLEKWGRDPFDRLIVAQARVRAAMLATGDERIRANYSGSIW